MILPPLDPRDAPSLKDQFMRFWHEGLTFKTGTSGIWYKTVLQHLEQQGHDLIPKELKELEEAIIRRGLSKQYLESLLDNSDELENEAKLLALTLASLDERLAGIKKLSYAYPTKINPLLQQMPGYLRLELSKIKV